jgi:AcrR family transcriptional regulator
MAAKTLPRLPRTYTISLENRKARGSGHERLEEILVAAKALFVEHGFENVSTQRIAARVGISKTALFSYYKTKDEILSRLIRDALEELARALSEIDGSTSNTADWLRRIVSVYVEFGLKHPDEYRLAFMIVKAHRKSGTAETQLQVGEGTRSGAAIFRRFEKKVRDAIREGAMRRDIGSATVVAQVLWASIHGLVALLIARPRPHFQWAKLDTLVKTEVEVLLGGLLASSREKR